MKRFLLLALAQLFFTMAEVVHAQEWTLLNPMPTYKSIISISFPTADTGFIVNEDYKIRRTTDGGQNWEILDFEDDAHFVEFTDVNTGYITSLSKIYKTTDGGETWVKHIIDPYASCWETHFINDTIGFAFGWAGYLTKTNDGGQTWVKKQSYNGSGSFNYTEMAFADLNTGYIVGMFDQQNWVLRRTDNGGDAWFDIEIPDSLGYVTSVSVLGPENIWISTGIRIYDSLPYPWQVYHSTNGGQTWSEHLIGDIFQAPDAITRIHFFNELEGFAMNDRQIFSTSDGGQTWMHEFIAPIYNVFISMKEYTSPNPQTRYFGGYGPSFVKTTDSGLSYQNLISGDVAYFRFIHFSDSANGFVGGFNNSSALIKYTEDAGETWHQASFDSTPSGINQVSFADKYNGWATFTNGIYRTYDGGKNWSILYQDVNENFVGISVPDLQHLYVWGLGSVRKSDDGGISWTDITPSINIDNLYLRKIHFPDQANGYLALADSYGNKHFFLKTTDAGETWTELFPGNSPVRLLDFCDPFNGIIQLENNQFMYTNDGGITWNNSVSTYAKYVKMFDPQNILFSNAGFKIALSNDGGETFNTTFTGTEVWAYSNTTCFTDAQHGFACGSGGMILRFDALLTNVVSPDYYNPVQVDFFAPNPAGDFLTILDNNYAKITISHTNGAIVKTFEKQTGKNLDISFLQPGVYLVTMLKEGKQISQKLIKL